MRSSVSYGGGMDHFLVFLSPCGLPRWMAVAWTVFWSFCHREVFCVLWRWHGPFSGLFVTMRSAATYGSGMDQFLVFLSPWGLLCLMVVAWTIFWPFCHREVCRGLWRWHWPFSGPFVTVRSAAANGGGMDCFLVFCHCEVFRVLWRWHGPLFCLSVTVRFATAYGGGMDKFLVFLSPWVFRRHGPFSGLSVTVRCATVYGSCTDHFLAFLSPWGLPCLMAVAWTTFWSFCHREIFHGLLRWHGPFCCPSVTVRSAAVDSVGMDHFLVFLSPWGLPHRIAVAWTIFWSFCHREVFRVLRRCHGPFSGLSITVSSAAAYGGGVYHFLAFLSPCGLSQQMALAWTLFCLPEHSGDTMQHFSFFLSCEVFRSTMATPWNIFCFFFCHHEVFRRMMVTPRVYFCSFLSLRGLSEKNVDTIGHFLVFSVTARPSGAQ